MKQDDYLREYALYCVALRVRAWIETKYLAVLYLISPVALRVRAWIETNK